MTPHDYADQDACGLADLIRRGQVSPEEVETCARRAITALNPVVNAVVAVDPPGVPFLCKDLVALSDGARIVCGSRLAPGLQGTVTSAITARHHAAGLVTLGRTATPELGFSVVTEPVATGPVRNPWRADRAAGGSSGGAAAAVACGMVPMAHANDGGGSIRIPAACTGLVGLKPTRGRISLGPGHRSILFGLGVEHAVTRTVRDCAALLDATQGPAVGDPVVLPAPVRPDSEEVGAPVERLRIAVTSSAWNGAAVAPDIADATIAAARLCESLGHVVAEASPRFDADALDRANLRLWTGSIAYAVDKIAAATGRVPGPETLERATLACYEHGRRVSAADLFEADDLINAVSRQIGAFFAEWDVLLTPTVARPPPLHGCLGGDAAAWSAEAWTAALFDFAPFTAPFNATGQPAVSLPLGLDSSGLPAGSQFVARFGREDVLLRLAASLEEARPWRDRRPPIWAGAL